VVVVADAVKPTSAEAVARFRDLGLRPMLLTGDNAAVARAVAVAVGIEPDDVIADVLPAVKVDAVRRLQSEGRVVAMVGDGVNDAAALAQADLGMAMGTGTDVAIEASDLTLVRGDLRVAADAIRLSRRTLGTIKGNLFWAFAYNVAALPLAAAGLLNPMLAGAAMALSSVFVVSNSLRLRGFKPLDDTTDGRAAVRASTRARCSEPLTTCPPLTPERILHSRTATRPTISCAAHSLHRQYESTWVTGAEEQWSDGQADSSSRSAPRRTAPPGSACNERGRKQGREGPWRPDCRLGRSPRGVSGQSPARWLPSRRGPPDSGDRGPHHPNGW
jgi:soluble P-type ATPase